MIGFEDPKDTPPATRGETRDEKKQRRVSFQLINVKMFSNSIFIFLNLKFWIKLVKFDMYDFISLT